MNSISLAIYGLKYILKAIILNQGDIIKLVLSDLNGCSFMEELIAMKKFYLIQLYSILKNKSGNLMTSKARKFVLMP